MSTYVKMPEEVHLECHGLLLSGCWERPGQCPTLWEVTEWKDLLWLRVQQIGHKIPHFVGRVPSWVHLRHQIWCHKYGMDGRTSVSDESWRNATKSYFFRGVFKIHQPYTTEIKLGISILSPWAVVSVEGWGNQGVSKAEGSSGKSIPYARINITAVPCKKMLIHWDWYCQKPEKHTDLHSDHCAATEGHNAPSDEPQERPVRIHWRWCVASWLQQSVWFPRKVFGCPTLG